MNHLQNTLASESHQKLFSRALGTMVNKGNHPPFMADPFRLVNYILWFTQKYSIFATRHYVPEFVALISQGFWTSKTPSQSQTDVTIGLLDIENLPVTCYMAILRPFGSRIRWQYCKHCVLFTTIAIHILSCAKYCWVIWGSTWSEHLWLPQRAWSSWPTIRFLQPETGLVSK